MFERQRLSGGNWNCQQTKARASLMRKFRETLYRKYNVAGKEYAKKLNIETHVVAPSTRINYYYIFIFQRDGEGEK